VKLGIVLPQGFMGEYAGWDPAAAWRRTAAVARQAEDLGFDSVWVYDHVGTFGELRDEPTLEAFAVLGAIAATTARVGIGPLVARAGLRNPALLAKHVAALDVISGGRFTLGLGAAAPLEETLSFGYPVLPIADRLAQLRETLEIVTPLLRDGQATFAGDHARAVSALNNPRGARQPRVPILVGGNGASTRRLATRFADELNLDGPPPPAAAAAMTEIRSLCLDLGRDPASLGVSVHILPSDVERPGSGRARLLAEYAEIGLRRVMAYVPGSADGDEALKRLARDARSAGLELP
jgi:alkanesulfonate monooxygenase SsuD/methylene tetrahydromethanopterin reductase-like flavin-dependent oxidoreductase (luciferase family)